MSLRRVPIKSTPSRRKRAFDAEYAAVLPSVLARGCEFRSYLFRSTPIPPEKGYTLACQGRFRGHHAKGRRARDANDPENLRCLCDGHHDYVHDHPRWAREVGLMLSRTS
jgi:hypothetical protein